MPNGDGHWYWEVVKEGRHVVMRGVSDDEPTACKEAGDAARTAKLISDS
jgi:hypothetical protein